jgi:hypothetical protein
MRCGGTAVCGTAETVWWIGWVLMESRSRWAYSGWSVLAFGRASCDRGAGACLCCVYGYCMGAVNG